MIAIEQPNEHKGELVMVRPSKFTVQNSKHIKSHKRFDAIMTKNPEFNKDKLVWEAEFWTPCPDSRHTQIYLKFRANWSTKRKSKEWIMPDLGMAWRPESDDDYSQCEWRSIK